MTSLKLARAVLLTLCALLLPVAGLAQGESPVTKPPAASAEAADEKTDAFTGVIRRIAPEEILVQQIGNGQPLQQQSFVRVSGSAETPVSGEGKNHWRKLRRGDVVVIAYRPGPPPETLKVLVLPPTAIPQVAETLGTTPRKGKREFTGWIKYKDESHLVVRTPDAPPPGKREGETKKFVRTDDTTIDLLRNSWDELRKGDRVTIEFSKGNPRPIKTLSVVTRGGEKPLPPGLATRLFDPEYDKTVKDVDGIGETKPVPKPARGGVKIKR